MQEYDSIYIMAKCPMCGVEKTTECHTEDLGCCGSKYYVGDHVRQTIIADVTQVRKLYCTANCSGHAFIIYVIIRGEKITGEYINIQY